MNVNLEIIVISPVKLVGMRIRQSLSERKTPGLWQSFVPQRNKIAHRKGGHFVSMQIFDEGTEFRNFTPETTFETWAAVEVSDFEFIPEGMEGHVLDGGEYAKFIHTGGPQTFPAAMKFFHENWLPQSG